MKDYQEYKIQIKMFGAMQVENQYGMVGEPGKESEAWKILKYLLVKRGVTVSQEEIQGEVWQEIPKDSYSSFRTRLSRLRSAFKDIKLSGKNGLILCENGLLDLNPEYDIQTDANDFDILIEQLRNTPVNHTEGLTLCAQALALYRGEYLGRTQGKWLEELRTHYSEEFQYLVRTTLERIKTLRDASALSILSSRVAAMMPEDTQLRNELVRIAAEIRQTLGTEPVPVREAISRGEEQSVRVRLFGPVELENQFGSAREVPGQPSRSWLMLKYLLINHGREVSQTEFMDQVLTDTKIDTKGNGDGALRVYLSRLRQALKPLQLDGRKGLVGYSAGFYSLNPEIGLETDADFFWVLMNKIRKTPLDDPHGLVLCVEALELFRGRFMENTEQYSWLELRQEKYNEEFCFLACSAMERMETLNDHAAISLLSRRALDIVPAEAELHHTIICFMMEQSLRVELLRHMTQWLDSGFADVSQLVVSREEDAVGETLGSMEEENAVAMSLFGSVELRNRHGRVKEVPEQTPEIWMLLKYLLLHRGREVSEEELARVLLADGLAHNAKNTFELRRRRMRDLLEPLKQSGTDALILYENGKYRVNPEYPIYTDEDLFQSLMKTIREIPEEDPEGLKACVEALELYRGEFMQHTKGASWLLEHRKRYYDEFSYLVHNAFRRMKALGNSDDVGLLSWRVAAMMPRAMELHMELISYMMEQNRQEELEGFIAAVK